jgi:oligosaccharide repeat unit polymerase
MMMLAYLLILALTQVFLRKKTPALLLLAIYCLSLTGSVLLQPERGDLKTVDVLNMIFMGLVLTLLIMPWSRINTQTPVIVTDEKRLYRLTKYLLILNGLVFVVMLVCVYYGFTTVQDYNAVKNGGDSELFIQSIPINKYVVLLSSYACPTAVFLLPLHFRYLKVSKFRLSFLCLLFSLNLILQGLTGFSRSGFLEYFFYYFFYLSFFYHKFDRRTKRLLQGVFAGVAVVLGLVFFAITNNRLAKVYNNGDPDNPLTSNPILYGLIDYGSQWYQNCIRVMSMYSFNTLYGQLSFPLPVMILDKFGFVDYPPEKQEMILSNLWGSNFDRFNGITANLLFDFGYIGTLLFAVGYRAIVRVLGRTQNCSYSFERYAVLGIPFLLVATGIFNYEMRSFYYNLLIIYATCFYLYLKKPAI